MTCKPARRENRAAYQKAYRASHREEIAAVGMAYRAAHREEIAVKRAVWYAEHREEITATHTAYYSAHREEAADHRAAHREDMAAYHATYRTAHREEIATYHAAYRAANREKLAATHAAWAKANPEKVNANSAARRARKLGNSIGLPKPDYKAILEEFGLICHLCEDEQTPIDLSAPRCAPNSLTMEHIWCVDDGGPHAAENLLPSHHRCNSIKGKKILGVNISREQIKARKAEMDRRDNERLTST